MVRHSRCRHVCLNTPVLRPVNLLANNAHARCSRPSMGSPPPLLSVESAR